MEKDDKDAIEEKFRARLEVKTESYQIKKILKMEVMRIKSKERVFERKICLKIWIQ